MPAFQRIVTVLALVPLTALVAQAPAQVLSICEIQYTTDPDGGGPHEGELVSCSGGIVVGKYEGTRPRIFLQDPDCPAILSDSDCPDGWGGIQVKDWTWPYELYDQVQVGDWVELANVRVEEYVGVTFLQYQPQNNPSLTVTPGYALPPPKIVPVSATPAPVEYPGDVWHVEHHVPAPECWESMRLIVRDVTVRTMDLGQARDNYALEDAEGANCWAADYMNADKLLWEDYHPFVSLDRHFCAVAGLLEQYTSGRFDYYQLVSLKTEDLAICGDASGPGGDPDGEVTIDDMSRFSECLIGPVCNGSPGGCDSPAWPPPLQDCLMMDFDYDADVDLCDFAGLQAALDGP
ncbi:MAG: hypothetical protein ACYS7M_04595 [Planctomycetota bacterium]